MNARQLAEVLSQHGVKAVRRGPWLVLEHEQASVAVPYVRNVALRALAMLFAAHELGIELSRGVQPAGTPPRPAQTRRLGR